MSHSTARRKQRLHIHAVKDRITPAIHQLRERHAPCVSLLTVMFKALSVGNLARIQEQIGNHPLKWNRLAASVVEVRQFAQYLVRVDCSDRTTLRNHQSIQLHSLSFLYSDLSSPNPTHVRAQRDPQISVIPRTHHAAGLSACTDDLKGHAENRHPFDFYSTSWNNPAYWIGTTRPSTATCNHCRRFQSDPICTDPAANAIIMAGTAVV